MKRVFTFYIMSCLIIGFVVESSHAEPSISQIRGTFIHDQSVDISGSGFGVKNPAAPLVWDDGTSNPRLDTYYDAWLPSSAQQGSYYNMSYREASFRGISAPNKRIRFFLGGAHATDTAAGSYSLGGNVGFGKNMTSHSYFIQYYYQIDPNFDDENNPNYGDNMKEIVLSNKEGSFYPDGWGAFGYADWCNSDVPTANNIGLPKLGRIPIDPENQSLPYGCSGKNLVSHNSPIEGWIKMQWEGVYNDDFDSPQYFLTTYPDGARTYQSHYGDGLTFSEYARGPWAGYPKKNDLRFVGVGGYARVPRFNNGVNSFRYFSAVYIDNTRARVMLGNNQDYQACTLMEPQIPSSWDDSSITFTVNLGSLSDSGNGYLFVFDANNNRNRLGFSVTIGDDSAHGVPQSPTNLRVEQFQ